MNNIINLAAERNIRKGINVDILAAAEVANTTSLRPGPGETKTEFVVRIVRQYKMEGGV